MQFIIDDRETPRFGVNRAVFVDPEVFQTEKEKIWDRAWLYVGHESEVPESNDFKAVTVGGRPLIFLRGEDGVVRVLANSCTHRGATLCREPVGNGRFFRCIYHAWSFDTSGHLVAIPNEEAYGSNLDRRRLALPSPRTESYRGFVFINYDRNADDLPTYLGGASYFLDLVADQSESGMMVVPGSHDYSALANWKLVLENSVDGYHPMAVHPRYFVMVKASGQDFSGVGRVRHRAFGNGHMIGEQEAVVIGRKLPKALRPEVARRRERLISIHGERRVARMGHARNLVIFPNLMVVDQVTGIALRRVEPVAPGYSTVYSQRLAPIDESRELRAFRLDDYLTFWGPAGLATPDDNEALESCQRGYAAKSLGEWNDLSRGMNCDDSEGAVVADEGHLRQMWRDWSFMMTGQLSAEEPASRMWAEGELVLGQVR